MVLLDPEKMYKDIPWLNDLVEKHPSSKMGMMSLAIDIACYSAKHGGGPFGTVIADSNNNVIECGCNSVMSLHDSTAHAEIVALRRAEKLLVTHDLSNHELFMYASCTPCVQCYGAIYWSGIKFVITGANKEDAEDIGFDEGVIHPLAWQIAKEKKDITYEPNYMREEALEAFRIYQENNGRIY